MKTLQDVNAEEQTNELESCFAHAEDARHVHDQLADYLAAETELLTKTRDRLQSSFKPCEASNAHNGRLTEAQRDLYILQCSLNQTETELLDAELSFAEALSGDPSCPCEDADSDDTDIEKAKSMFTEKCSEFESLLDDVGRAETLEVLLADFERKRDEMEIQNSILMETVNVLESQCARIVMLASLIESVEIHSRKLSDLLLEVKQATSDALNCFRIRSDENTRIHGNAARDIEAPATEADAAFIRATADLCITAAKNASITLDPEEMTFVSEQAYAGSRQLGKAKDVIVRWIKMIRTVSQKRKTEQVCLLQHELDRAGVSLPLTESDSVDTLFKGDKDLLKLEELQSMAEGLLETIQRFRSEVTDVLKKEKEDELFNSKRRLWEYFIRDPDKLVAFHHRLMSDEKP